MRGYALGIIGVVINIHAVLTPGIQFGQCAVGLSLALIGLYMTVRDNA